MNIFKKEYKMNQSILCKFQMTVLLVLVSGFITSIHASEDIKIINLENTETKTQISPDDNSSKISTATGNSEVTKSESKPETVAKSKSELKVLYKTFNLTPEAALVVAQAAMKNCRDSGYQVAVAVLDKGGNIQVILRDRLAGITTPDIALLKARTALSFRAATSTLTNDLLKDKSLQGIKDVPGVLLLAGAVNITAAGTIIGAIGVSGAPSPKFDERCAIFGLKPIEGLLEFAE